MNNRIVDNDTVNTIVEKVKHTRLLGAIGLISILLGTVLPYIKYNAFVAIISKSLFSYWEGKIVILLLIINLILFFKDYIEKYIPSLLNINAWRKISELNYQYVMVPAIIAILLVIYRTIKIDISFGHYNIGFYTLWFGVICIVIYLIINKGKPEIQEKNTKGNNETYSDFQNMNKQTENVNLNYNNRMNNNGNQNYNSGVNNNINPNYNNRINNNANPNYNNGMNYGINQNNSRNYNINQSYYNGQNANYNPNNNYNNVNQNSNIVNPNTNNNQNNNIVNPNTNNNQNNNM